MIWTLLLRLAGPMQAWGVQSRFEVRDSGTEPSKSGVVGLICAALGIDRAEPIPEEIRSLRMGVRVDREGEMRRDYQTAVHWRAERRTRKWVPGRTTLSERYFLADASFLVGLESSDHDLLLRIAEAIDRPRWTLCLGRRACPPGRPIRVPDGLRSGLLEDVLAAAPWEERERKEKEKVPKSLRTVVEMRDDAGDGLVLLRRPDQPVSFLPRRFAMRDVVVRFIPNPSHAEAGHAH